MITKPGCRNRYCTSRVAKLIHRFDLGKPAIIILFYDSMTNCYRHFKLNVIKRGKS